MSLPELALSVRQPWAWAIVHAGKDIENRSWQAVNHGLNQRGRIAVHASKGMTRSEYESAARFMEDELEIVCPLPADLYRGGIIGSVEVTGVVTDSNSPWFVGPRGLVLADAQACDPVEAPGALGYFRWQAAPTNVVPAQWMLRYADPAWTPNPVVRTDDLFNT